MDEIRIQACNGKSVDPSGEFVLYWMSAYHRVGWNFSLERAVEWSRSLAKGLVILEDLRCGGRWDCDRFHAFALNAMADNAERLRNASVSYYPYIERREGEADGLLRALSARAAVVVTDDYPMLPHRSKVVSAAESSPVLMERVDSNGLLPMSAYDRVFTTAYSFRRFLQKNLHAYLLDFPKADPIKSLQLPAVSLPAEIIDRWQPATEMRDSSCLAHIPIDHSVLPTALPGGASADESVLGEFLETRLDGYSENRNHPDYDATSHLSPYLSHGQISAHQIFAELSEREGWDLSRISPSSSGLKSGWWRMSPDAEAWLDQLVTWRELGFNMTSRRDDYDKYNSLPEWAIKTLAEHADDPHPEFYSLGEFENAQTGDRLWNAAQTQLVREGRMHNYVRMVWGKKILQWSETPEQALETMIHLNNKYALDGSDPNSYSGIFWCLGRYDRPWGPKRRIFGTVRYMSSENTVRKVRVKKYLERYGTGLNAD
jgi:deoxyribodipyrimidine photo-lyase